MKRFGYGVAVLLVSACSQTPPQIGTGLPSLHTAQAALEGGAPDVALNICQENLASGQRTAAVLVCEGDALAALKRPDAADTAYTTALLLDPDAEGALLGLGRLRLGSDPKRAEELFMRVLAHNPRNPLALNDVGIARDLLGRHADAQQAYGLAIAANPDMRAAQVNLALSTALAGHPDDAARLMAPLAIGPDASTRERHDLAAVLAMDGQTEAAAKLLSPELQGADLEAALAGYRSLLKPPP